MENNLNIFKHIVDFINELNDLCGARFKSVFLYKRIIKSTTFTHEIAIKRNIELFRSFCTENRDAIQTTDEKLIKNPVISYSDRVFLNFKEIFAFADEESKKSIWQHILVLSAFLDPLGNAKKVLKDMASKKEEGGNEEKFLNSLLEKIEASVDPAKDSTPTAAISNMLQNGTFNNILSSVQTGFESGNLDITKLLGAMQGMMTKIGGPDATAGMMGGLGNPLDMLKMLGPMLDSKKP